MINEIMKPMGPTAELGLQRTQAPTRTGGPDPTGQAGRARESSASSQAPPSLDRENATKLADDLNQMVQQVSRQLHFKVDSDSGKTLIQVVDKTTGEMLRQIPSEEIVALQHRLSELQESGSAADASSVGSLFVNSQA